MLSVLGYCTVVLCDVNFENVVHNVFNELYGISGRIVSDDLILNIVEYDVSADVNDELDQLSVSDGLD